VTSAYLTPRVYLEWQDATQPSLTAVRTDIAGFVGIARRGPLHRAVKIESWTQFVRTFGAHTQQGYLAYVVEGFFANGGRACYVVRVADPFWAKTASLELSVQNTIIRLTASSPGAWANALTVTTRFTGIDRLMLTIELPSGEREIWRDLSLNPNIQITRTRGTMQRNPRYMPELLNGPNGSFLVTVEVMEQSNNLEFPDPGSAVVRLSGGEDGVWTLQSGHFTGNGSPASETWGLTALESVQDVGIVAIPDMIAPPPRKIRTRQRPSRCDHPVAEAPNLPIEADPDQAPGFTDEHIQEIQDALITHCEQQRDRVAILYTKPNETDLEVLSRRRASFESSFAALYHPWLRVPDPLEPQGALISVPPCGHVAGIYAQTELAFGVHQPPANKPLELVLDVQHQVDDSLHGSLNEQHINVIRSLPGRGIRVMGARTLSYDSLWRYVNVRRLLIMIEQSIERQTQWLVFEPNIPATWREIDRVVRSFLNGLWLRGMLDGSTENQAYHVVCDQTTNPSSETDLGRMTTLIGVLPPWPAEFVIVRLRRSEQGTQFLEGAEHG
jgi:uncharacterized protein